MFPAEMSPEVALLRNGSFSLHVTSFLMSALRGIITESILASTSQYPSPLAEGCHIPGNLQEDLWETVRVFIFGTGHLKKKPGSMTLN